MPYTLSIFPNRYAVCCLANTVAIPGWALAGGFYSITRDAAELSLVCEETQVPLEVPAERGWRAMQVQGPLDFGLIGILAEIAAILARADVSIFAISSYSTDTILVKEDSLQTAISALRAAGHQVMETPTL